MTEKYIELHCVFLCRNIISSKQQLFNKNIQILQRALVIELILERSGGKYVWKIVYWKDITK